jgi:hypothetical protein
MTVPSELQLLHRNPSPGQRELLPNQGDSDRHGGTDKSPANGREEAPHGRRTNSPSPTESSIAPSPGLFMSRTWCGSPMVPVGCRRRRSNAGWRRCRACTATWSRVATRAWRRTRCHGVCRRVGAGIGAGVACRWCGGFEGCRGSRDCPSASPWSTRRGSMMPRQSPSTSVSPRAQSASLEPDANDHCDRTRPGLWSGSPRRVRVQSLRRAGSALGFLACLNRFVTSFVLDCRDILTERAVPHRCTFTTSAIATGDSGLQNQELSHWVLTGYRPAHGQRCLRADVSGVG